MTRPATKERASPPGKTFSPEKMPSLIVCIIIVFVHAIDVKFGPPQKILPPPRCPNLVAGLLVTVVL